jgi:hypothetical protein
MPLHLALLHLAERVPRERRDHAHLAGDLVRREPLLRPLADRFRRELRLSPFAGDDDRHDALAPRRVR